MLNFVLAALYQAAEETSFFRLCLCDLAKHAMNAACLSPEAEDGLCYSIAAFPGKKLPSVTTQRNCQVIHYSVDFYSMLVSPWYLSTSMLLYCNKCKVANCWCT